MTIPNQPIADYVIIAPPRTGSSYIAYLLNTHDDIRGEGEVFGSIVFAHPQLLKFPNCIRVQYHPSDTHLRKLLKKLWNGVITFFIHRLAAHRDKHVEKFLRKFRTYPPQKRYFGYKILTTQANGLALLPRIAPTKIIWLRRRNIVKQAVSMAIATIRHKWQTDKQDITSEQIVVEPARIIGWIQKIREQETMALQLIHDMKADHIEVVYEDFFGDMPSGFQRIASFLGVSPDGFHPEKMTIFKLTPPNLRHVLTNYDEIHHALADDVLRAMLEETGL